MVNTKIRFVLALTAVFVVQGCSSLNSKFKYEFGHPYSGLESSISSFSCKITVSRAAFFFPVPLIIIDVPLSALIDTLLLPVDIVVNSESQRREVIFTEKKCLEGMGN